MENKQIILTMHYQAPCGVLVLGSLGHELCLCEWHVKLKDEQVYRRLKRLLHADMTEGTSPVIEQAAAQLDEYFAGRRRTFSMPLRFAGTDFQLKVWHELLKIPYGETLSYGEMARRIGMPKAVRAVANANAANALSIFAPCHRVIGSDRSLTGYAGGLDVKHWLLTLERAWQ